MALRLTHKQRRPRGAATGNGRPWARIAPGEDTTRAPTLVPLSTLNKPRDAVRASTCTLAVGNDVNTTNNGFSIVDQQVTFTTIIKSSTPTRSAPGTSPPPPSSSAF